MPETPKLIGTAEAATRLRTDRSNITRWVHAGKITAVHKGTGKTGEFFFTDEEVTRVENDIKALDAQAVAS